MVVICSAAPRASRSAASRITVAARRETRSGDRSGLWPRLPPPDPGPSPV